MALIPLAAIPNAPQTAGVPLDPASLRAVKVGNENQRGPDLSGVAQSLLTPTIRQGAFDGAAEGMDALGQGLARLGDSGRRIGAVIEDARARKQQHHDEGELARIDAATGQAFEAYRGTLPGRKESEYLAGWQAELPKIRESLLKDSTLSEEGKARADIYFTRFAGKTGETLISTANRNQIERDTGDRLALANRQRAAGDNEGAHGTLGRLVDEGAMRRDQMEAQIKRWSEEDADATIATAMNADPDGFIQDIEDGSLDESTIIKPDQKPKLIAQAKQVRRQQISEADDQLDELVLTGGIKTEKEIRLWAEQRGIPERQILSHVKSLSVVNDSTEAGMARVQAARVDIQAEISAYNPETDVDDKQYFAIKDKVRANLPEGLRQEFLSDISAMRREGRKTPEQEVKANISGQIRDLRANEFFGKTDKPKESLLASQKANALMDQFREYQKQMGGNLQQADADAWLAAQVKGDVRKFIATDPFQQQGVNVRPANFSKALDKPKTQADYIREVDAALTLPK